jgi:hypothetical protein
MFIPDTTASRVNENSCSLNDFRGLKKQIVEKVTPAIIGVI